MWFAKRQIKIITKYTTDTIYVYSHFETLKMFCRDQNYISDHEIFLCLTWEQ